jgi:hypothetical protein
VSALVKAWGWVRRRWQLVVAALSLAGLLGWWIIRRPARPAPAPVAPPPDGGEAFDLGATALTDAAGQLDAIIAETRADRAHNQAAACADAETNEAAHAAISSAVSSDDVDRVLYGKRADDL